MIINSYVNYGGRLSRLCFNIPLLVHSIIMYIIYFCYFNINLYNFYVFAILMIIVNIEWLIVLVYEYMYLYNTNVNNNLQSNMILFIFLEIVLFAGVYWAYLDFQINPNNFSTFNPVSSYYYNITTNNTSIFSMVYTTSNVNLDICLYIVISNLLILLYVTLILQYLHIYLQI